MPRFGVVFADQKQFFYPGETIVGNVIIRLDEEIECRSINLKFRGRSAVYFETGGGNNRRGHCCDEEYFRESRILLQPVPPDAYIHLRPGDYSYPFQFQLPQDLPPSVIVPAPLDWFGFIAYFMKIKIDVGSSWKSKSDLKSKIVFRVAAKPVDLSQRPELLEPVSDAIEKFLCCLCCQSGPIRLRSTIQKQAYHIGEEIVFSFEIDNKETDKPLRTIEARLMQKFTLMSENWSIVCDNIRASVILSDGIPPRGEESWNDVRFAIPGDIVPSFDNCKCIHLQYYFKVNVDIQGAFDPKVVFPITIGNSGQPVVGQPTPFPGNGNPGAPSVMYPPLSVLPPPGQMPPPADFPPPADDSPHPVNLGPPIVTEQPAPSTWIPLQPPPTYS